MFHRRRLALRVTTRRRIAFLLFCAPTLVAAAPQVPTFNRDIVPIIENRCQECHRPGEVAPMAFVTYQQTRPWAKAIREAVLLKKMPPWFAEPGYGPFERPLSHPAGNRHIGPMGGCGRAGRKREGPGAGAAVD